MDQQPLAMAFAKTVHCLEVFQAVQTDCRTSGWYWGDVRGKASVGAATDALLRRDLICSRVGPPPFAITAKGEAFLKTHEHAWTEFLAKTDQPSTIEHFARALTEIPEVLTAPTA
ncbi:MAG: hypothetical protein HOP18_28615 [Deltaproteobacteria bacterium]|nr:hypothetical protein [Deltaproteobacteria bacterium]